MQRKSLLSLSLDGIPSKLDYEVGTLPRSRTKKSSNLSLSLDDIKSLREDTMRADYTSNEKSEGLGSQNTPSDAWDRSRELDNYNILEL
jgi:hypothetical protein